MKFQDDISMPKPICTPLFSKLGGIKMSSFKSSENIQKKEGGPDRSVSDNPLQ